MAVLAIDRAASLNLAFPITEMFRQRPEDHWRQCCLRVGHQMEEKSDLWGLRVLTTHFWDIWQWLLETTVWGKLRNPHSPLQPCEQSFVEIMKRTRRNAFESRLGAALTDSIFCDSMHVFYQHCLTQLLLETRNFEPYSVTNRGTE